MEHEGHQGEKRAMLLSGTPFGKEELLVGQQLHERIAEMYRSGRKKKEIARLLDVDVKTVRKITRGEPWKPYERTLAPVGVLDPWKEWVTKRAPEVNDNARVLFRELREQGYQGSYDTVKVFIRPLRIPSALWDMTVRFETGPGEQAQVDWGSRDVWFGESRVRVHFFVMTLGYSRRMFVRASPNERLGSLLAGHEEAFAFFGGVTDTILYDNPKTMVIRRESGTVVMNTVFEDFARHWGYQPRFCRPYRARTKGKVENGVKYVKRNFLAGRRFRDMAHLNEELERWNREVADVRIHGTTGERLLDRFREERLTPCATVPPSRAGLPGTRTVSREGWVCWKGQKYSVPLSWGPLTVRVREEGDEVVIQSPDKGEVRHPRLLGNSGQSHRLLEHHRPESLPSSPRPRREEAPPQHDPRWRDEEVEVRNLEAYEALMTTEVA
uniref:Integrase, catalytic region n=1 Tax=Leptospirillum ferrodiazotrophum TaxID=412449 RepID=C6I033_9BACT|nr:MAG: Integrase, catalytic region [Leptospirillum ferrodiazotrophum]